MPKKGATYDYAGLDISMKETVICIVDEKGKIIHKGRSKTDVEKIIHHLLCTKLKIEKIGLESGSTSYWLVKNLKERGFTAICVDSRKMAVILSIKVHKTDDNDAQGIAEAIRCGMYHEVIQKSPSAVGQGTLMQARRTLVQQKVQIINSVRGLLKTYGICLGPSGEKEFSIKVRKQPDNIFETAIVGIEGLLNIYEALCVE
jgi:transposase